MMIVERPARGPEDEPEDSEDAYEPLDTIDLTESDLTPDIEVSE